MTDTPDLIQSLRQFDSASIANAIEHFEAQGMCPKVGLFGD